MAKLKAPLLSFGASGKLADTLVYFPWKGLAVVRSYVIPANPNSAGQQTQRGILTESVASWHALGLDDDDVTAWNRYAASRPPSPSAFPASSLPTPTCATTAASSTTATAHSALPSAPPPDPTTLT